MSHSDYTSNRQSEVSLNKLRNSLAGAQGTPVLNLADAFIGDAGCELVAQFLRENPGTTTVELRGNNIGPEGAAYLATALSGQTSVRNLSLEWNAIGNGLDPLMEALTINSKLEALDLRNNRIGPEGATYISRMLQANKSINKLDLRWNEIGASGANELLAGLRVNTSIKQIELAGNKIPENLLGELESGSKDQAAPTKQIAGMFESVVPLKLLNKEKEYADELQSKYESHLITNSRAEARIAELESLFDMERKKTKDVRQDLVRDIENARNARSIADNDLLSLKEEAMRKEVEDGQRIQDLELKISQATNDRNSLNFEFNKINDAYKASKMHNEEKIKSLEDRYSQQQRAYRQLENQTKSAYEQAKAEHEQELADLTRDYQARLEMSESTLKSIQDMRDATEADYKSLNVNFMQEKNKHTESVIELEHRIRDEIMRSFNSNIRSLEQRMKTLEESREALVQKNKDLNREILNTSKKYADKMVSLEDQINQLRDEKAEAEAQLTDVKGNVDLLGVDLKKHNHEYEQTMNVKDKALKHMAEKKDLHKTQLEKLHSDQANEQRRFKQVKDDIEAKKGRLNNKLKLATDELQNIRKEHDKLKEMLTTKFDAIIEETVNAHLQELESRS